MTMAGEYLNDKEIDQMSIRDLKNHFLEFTYSKMRMYVQKGVIRQTTLDKARNLFEVESDEIKKVRREYKKILTKCPEWRRKYGMKFKHIPAGR